MKDRLCYLFFALHSRNKTRVEIEQDIDSPMIVVKNNKPIRFLISRKRRKNEKWPCCIKLSESQDRISDRSVSFVICIVCSMIKRFIAGRKIVFVVLVLVCLAVIRADLFNELFQSSASLSRKISSSIFDRHALIRIISVQSLVILFFSNQLNK